MAGTLRGFKVHGAFDRKSDARKKEKEVHGFILERKIKGKKRFVVLTHRFM